MKKTIIILLLLSCFLSFSSFQNEGVLNHPMPLLPNKTLDGQTIDADYYKGHVTIVSFMFIGCIPCMNEISVLDEIQDEYAANLHLQILCVARQMREQMIQFNDTGNSSCFSMVRRAMKVNPISYTIQPGCATEPSKMVVKDMTEDGNSKDVSLKSECNTIEETFGISAFPCIFFVDKKGIVRKIKEGGPAIQNDAAFHDQIKKEIDALLAE